LGISIRTLRNKIAEYSGQGIKVASASRTEKFVPRARCSCPLGSTDSVLPAHDVADEPACMIQMTL
jgi:hypothetical protein